MSVVAKFKLGASRLIIHCMNGDFLSLPREGVDESIADRLKCGSSIAVSENKEKGSYKIMKGRDLLYSE